MEKNNDQNNTNNKSSQPVSQQGSQKKKEIHISAASKDRAEAAKAYIERKYAKVLQNEINQKEHWQLLQKKMSALNFSQAEQELIKRDILYKEAEHTRKLRQKIGPQDYEPLAIIGRGAFGEVRVCRDKETKQIVAIKKMKKNEMLYKNQIGHVRAERYVLSTYGNPWIVELKQAFQDDKYLYLVMEFLVGGDLMTVLMKKDILTEEEAKFYTAELVLSVASVHKMDYIHRDLKPDNVLLGKDGHIKLSDFGLCKQTEIRPKIDFGRRQQAEDAIKNNPTNILTKRPANFQRNRQLAFSTVGTPDYIAPEVFGQQGYTETVDWWSIGVILFEMLVGYPPFFSEDPSMTCQKILHWKKTFMIPPEANLSPAAADLIKRLISDQSDRLGINGVEEIKAHPFFSGVDWRRIREKPAPYVPPVNDEIDVQNFDKFTEEDPWVTEETEKKNNRKVNVNFVGYTFKRDIEGERSPLVKALENLENTKVQQQQHIKTTQVQRNYSPRPEIPNYSQNKSNNNIMGGRDMNQQQQQQQQQQQYNYMYGQKQKNMNSSKGSNEGRPRSPLNNYQQQYQIKPNSQNRSPSPNTMQKYGNTYFLQQMNKNQYLYQGRDERSPMRGSNNNNNNQFKNPNNSNNNIRNNNNGNNVYSYKKQLPQMGSGQNSPRVGYEGNNNRPNVGYSPKYYQANQGQRNYSPNTYRNYQ